MYKLIEKHNMNNMKSLNHLAGLGDDLRGTVIVK